jgi:hypothetical protein
MFIRCKFTSAKVSFNNTDYVLEFDKKEKKVRHKERTKFVDPSNLISFSQISNVLHVLMGARPAPINRETFHKRNAFIDNLAEKSWVRITNKYSYQNKDGKECYYKEFTQGKKTAWNSNSSSSYFTNETGDNLPILKGFVTWSTFKKKFYFSKKENYIDAIETFERLSGMSFNEIKTKYTLYEFLVYLLSDPKNEVELNKLGERIDYKNITKLETISNSGNKNNLAILTINTNPTEKITLNGEIIYEIYDEDVINTLRYGNKLATFLDGGMLEIVEIDEYINIDDDYISKDELPDYGFKLITKN